jgi:hypothetical protein
MEWCLAWPSGIRSNNCSWIATFRAFSPGNSISSYAQGFIPPVRDETLCCYLLVFQTFLMAMAIQKSPIHRGIAP